MALWMCGLGAVGPTESVFSSPSSSYISIQTNQNWSILNPLTLPCFCHSSWLIFHLLMTFSNNTAKSLLEYVANIQTSRSLKMKIRIFKGFVKITNFVSFFNSLFCIKKIIIRVLSFLQYILLRLFKSWHLGLNEELNSQNYFPLWYVNKFNDDFIH